MNFQNNLNLNFSSLNFFQKFIAISVVVFILSIFLYLFNFHDDFIELFSLENNFISKPWSIITYSFIHGFETVNGVTKMNGLSSIFDLLWLIIFLTFSSNAIINLLGEKIAVKIFFYGVLVGGIFYLILNNANNPLIGASAGYSSLLFFLLFLSPNLNLRVFSFDIKFKYLMYIYLIRDFIYLLLFADFGVYAHIGGYLVAIYYYFALYGLPNLNKNKKQISRKSFENKQTRVDQILDKISKSGYDSLDDDDKEYLFKQGGKK